jgi:pyruvate,water dikinase
VLFTANSPTGRRRQRSTPAPARRSGRLGAVNLDHFVVDTDSGEIIERRSATSGSPSVPARGGTEQVERPADANAASITDDQIRALTALGDRVEAVLRRAAGHRVGDRCRRRAVAHPGPPITTLFPLPSNAPPPGADLRVYMCFSLAQGLTRPITPMGLAAFRVLASSASEVFGLPGRRPTGRRAVRRSRPASFADVTSACCVTASAAC